MNVINYDDFNMFPDELNFRDVEMSDIDPSDCTCGKNNPLVSDLSDKDLQSIIDLFEMYIDV